MADLQSLNLNNSQSSVIQNITRMVSNVVNQYIVRPTGNNPTTGISGFVFDVVAEEEVILESEITDHYVESNYAVQDHIAQKPVRFIAKGYVADITDLFPNTLLSMLTTIQSLASIGSFATAFSVQATETYNKIANAVQPLANYVAQAKNVFSILSNSSTTANKQQQAYQTFYNFWLNRQKCSVEGPWGVLYDMVIERVNPVQDENTRFITQFTVSFKQLRTVDTHFISALINNPAGSGSILGALQGQFPSSPSKSTGILSTAFQTIQGNTLGRVSYSLSPTDILGQTAGQDADLGVLGTAFSLPSLVTT